MKDWINYLKERKDCKLYFKIIGIAAALAVSITGYMAVEGQAYKPIDLLSGDSGIRTVQNPDGSTSSKLAETVPKPLMVQISGCVKEPGIYTMLEGQRVIDAIELAGGATMDIDDKSINLVAKVKDGQKIYFQPKKIDSVVKSETVNNQGNVISNEEKASIAASGKININTANASELQRLPGIGEYYAKKIIDYRTSKGPFKDIGSVIKVSGIGAARYEQIKAYITVK